MARASLCVGGLLFEQSLLGVALHIYAQGGPLLAPDEIGDQPLQFRGILNLVLRFAEDGAQ